MSEHDPKNLIADITQAQKAIAPYLHNTPLTRSEFLSKKTGKEIYLKEENLQRTGSFKVRGALAKLSTLEGEDRHKGVVCSSAGNHGLGVAFASRSLGIPALVFVPQTVAQTKLRALKELLVKVRVEGSCYDETEAIAKKVANEADATFVSPFDDPWVIAGNGGTTGLEIKEQLPNVKTVIAPIGGGGLIGGLAEALPGTKMIGVNSAISPAMALSLAENHVYERFTPKLDAGTKTLAEGLEGGITKRTFDLCKKHQVRVEKVSEEEIANAIYTMAKAGKVIEGSAATAIALALRDDALKEIPDPICIIITGRNIDKSVLEQILRAK